MYSYQPNCLCLASREDHSSGGGGGWRHVVTTLIASNRVGAWKHLVAKPSLSGVVSLSHSLVLLCVLHLDAWKSDWDTICILGSW